MVIVSFFGLSDLNVRKHVYVKSDYQFFNRYVHWNVLNLVFIESQFIADDCLTRAASGMIANAVRQLSATNYDFMKTRRNCVRILKVASNNIFAT